MPKKKTPRTSDQLTGSDNLPIDVDEFDEPHTRATNVAAVLDALAEAKAIGDTNADERGFWFGVQALTAGLLKDLERMDAYQTQASNYIFNLENGRRPGKGERQEPRRIGGAR